MMRTTASSNRSPKRAQRTNVLKKMAQTYRERQLEPRRAVEVVGLNVAAHLDLEPFIGGPDEFDPRCRWDWAYSPETPTIGNSRPFA